MKKAAWILGIAAVFSVAVMCFLQIRSGMTQEQDFVPPTHDPLAVVGTPAPEEKYRYTDGPAGDSFAVKLATQPYLENGEIVLYFTNPEGNTALLRVRIYRDDEVIAESGYLRPGEYLRALAAPEAETGTIKVKIMSYQEDTWYSLGAYSMALTLTEG